MADHTAESDVSPLREAAAWIAESIGYPIECKMPERPMPEALWQALVDHVHADEAGRWHGNELDRDGTESWLADEAGRDIPVCVCGTLSDLGGPGRHHDEWCPLYRVTPAGKSTSGEGGEPA